MEEDHVMEEEHVMEEIHACRARDKMAVQINWSACYVLHIY
jgi:hypothetical protein